MVIVWFRVFLGVFVVIVAIVFWNVFLIVQKNNNYLSGVAVFSASYQISGNGSLSSCITSS